MLYGGPGLAAVAAPAPATHGGGRSQRHHCRCEAAAAAAVAVVTAAAAAAAVRLRVHRPQPAPIDTCAAHQRSRTCMTWVRRSCVSRGFQESIAWTFGNAAGCTACGTLTARPCGNSALGHACAGLRGRHVRAHWCTVGAAPGLGRGRSGWVQQGRPVRFRCGQQRGIL